MNTPKITWQQQLINDIIQQEDDYLLSILQYNPQRIFNQLNLESFRHNLDIKDNLYYKFIDLYNDCRSFNFCPICTNQLSHDYDYNYCEQHQFYLPDNHPLISFEDCSTNGKILMYTSHTDIIPLNTLIPNYNNLSLINIIHAINKYNIFK